MHYPLLSDAYVAALERKHDVSAKAAPRPGAPMTSLPTPAEKPFLARKTERDDDRKSDDDMETARTRPLRLDRIHL
jgi:hypothetical protein